MAAMAALLRSSTAHLLNPDHRLSSRILRLCSLPLASSASQTLESQPKRSITNVVDILRERGLVHSITSDKLQSVCSNPDSIPLKIYCRFDPTAESLHLGNLIGLIVLSWFLRCGHQVFALIEGEIGQVEDPSGKSVQRAELAIETIEKNSAEIRSLVCRILHRTSVDLKMGCIKDEILNSDSKESCNCFAVLDNSDWWKKENKFLDFLVKFGRYYKFGTMTTKEGIKKVLPSEKRMNMNEFIYQLMQAYDYVYMFKNIGVNVQIGGSDQWENITYETVLIRKILKVEGAYGLAFSLLLNSDGSEFGNSEGGAIWLSPAMLSPYKFYQYFFSVPDVDVVRFLKILTFLNLEEIQELEEAMKKPGYVPNLAQKKLAENVTRFVHGEEGLAEAMKATETLKPGTVTKLDSHAIEEISKDVPSFYLPYDRLLNSLLVDISVSSGLLGSKSDVRRLMKQGGLYLNNKRVDNDAMMIEESDIVSRKFLLLSAGKKKKMIIRAS